MKNEILFLFLYSVTAVRINEVADKGSSSACNGADWVELYVPPSEETSNLTGYILHDDNGPDDEDAYKFSSTVINSGEYLLLCMKEAGFPQFGIGSDDTITLLGPDQTVISTTGQLSSEGLLDVTYAWDENNEEFVYTSTPSPGSENILTPTLTLKDRLEAQNALGIDFFNMDDNGYPVPGGFDDVVDLRMVMDPAEFSKMWDDQSYEVYSPFLSLSVTSYGNPDDVLLNLTSPGRIRPRGQSSLALPTCMNFTNIPFKIDFSSSDGTQTLYGTESIYLRNHFSDASSHRDWAVHRMLARFGLPHLRTRTARFYINDQFMGIYTVMEAIDQPYVFHRSFPDFDSSNHALYKAKTASRTCGEFTNTQLAQAQARINETSTPPYAYERGDHREKIEVLSTTRNGMMNPQLYMQCAEEVLTKVINPETNDAVLAYLRAEEDCGKMLVEEGLMDRDLGSNEWDDDMQEFINTHLSGFRCDEGCTNSNLPDDVDLDNFLANFAVYAVLISHDSPMGIGNNYLLAQSGDNNGWKLVQYDHNGVGQFATLLCSELCAPKLVNWSIVRPTCGPLEDNKMVGPLLADPELHQRYIEYVRQFTTTVVTNSSFLEQVQNHALSLEKVVPEDPFYFTYHYETSLDPDNWEGDFFGLIKTYPLLPFLVARGNEVLKQLAALDNGTFPRGPHLPVKVEPHELCVDWHSEVDESPCYKNCKYEGCQQGSQTGEFDLNMEFFLRCDALTGDCYHGYPDEKCAGIPMGEQYDGITSDFEGSDEIPVCAMFGFKAELCPKPEEKIILVDNGSIETLAGVSGGRKMGVAITIVIPILTLFMV